MNVPVSSSKVIISLVRIFDGSVEWEKMIGQSDVNSPKLTIIAVAVKVYSISSGTESGPDKRIGA